MISRQHSRQGSDPLVLASGVLLFHALCGSDRCPFLLVDSGLCFGERRFSVTTLEVVV